MAHKCHVVYFFEVPINQSEKYRMKQNVGIMEFHKVALAAAFYMGTCSSDCDCSFGRQSNRRIMASWAKMIQDSCVHSDQLHGPKVVTRIY